MLARLVMMSVLCQVFTLMIADYNPDATAAVFDDGGMESARAERGAEPDNKSCSCARGSTAIQLNQKWPMEKLDKLLKWVSSVVDSLTNDELDGGGASVVVMPVIVDEGFNKGAVTEVHVVPQNRAEVVVDETTGGRAEVVVDPPADNTEGRAETLPPADNTEGRVQIVEIVVSNTTDTTPTTEPTTEEPPKDPQVVCLLPRDKGLCKAIRRQWFYNATAGDCSLFVYGGCGGNDNRFFSREECRSFCSGVGVGTTVQTTETSTSTTTTTETTIEPAEILTTTTTTTTTSPPVLI